MARGTQHVTRTTDILKAEGFTYGIVERRIPRSQFLPHGKTIDFLGLGDVLAFKGDSVRLIQVCGSDYAPHVKKMLGGYDDPTDAKEIKAAARRVDNARKWLESPYRTLELWGWRTLVVKNKDGTKAKVKRWTPRVKIFTLEDYNGTQIF